MARHGIGQKTSHLYQVDNVVQLPGAGDCLARLSILCNVWDGDQPWRGHATLRCRIRTEQLGVLAATNGLTLFFTSRSAPASISSFATPSAFHRAAYISAVHPSCAPNHGGSPGGGEGGGADQRTKGVSDFCTSAHARTHACTHACMHACMRARRRTARPYYL